MGYYKELVNKNIECLNTFLENAETDMQELINIFSKYLYKENTSRMDITVGCREDSVFNVLLTSTIYKFMLKLALNSETPAIIIEDSKIGKTTAMFCLSEITDIRIEVGMVKGNTYFDIGFRYKNEIDYNIRIIEKG